MKYIKLIIIAALIITADQITKQMIINNFFVFESVPVIDGLFNITYLQNLGGAFSFFADKSILLRSVIFKILPIIVIFFLFLFYKTVPSSSKFLTFGLSFIISGAIANLIDRFVFGFVIDFLDFYVNNIHWPAFNIADSAITVGIVMVLIGSFTDKSAFG
ncbi:MAG: signal peptidase II [Deltaproteobacteria bacterium]|nr:signal peptidase II [Deltaproteobacteria bacterium]